jgi:hypothetical protein
MQRLCFVYSVSAKKIISHAIFPMVHGFGLGDEFFPDDLTDTIRESKVCLGLILVNVFAEDSYKGEELARIELEKEGYPVITIH